MDLIRSFWFRAVFVMLMAGLTASTFISDSVFESHGSTSRNLLQTKKACPVNFEFLNYTVITSQCKGPQYPAKLCCGALKELACPYYEELNDGTNDCASTMFSYINLFGKYPPGLFASECREGKEGLSCSDIPPSASQTAEKNTVDNTSAAHITRSIFPMIALVSVLVLGFLF